MYVILNSSVFVPGSSNHRLLFYQRCWRFIFYFLLFERTIHIHLYYNNGNIFSTMSTVLFNWACAFNVVQKSQNDPVIVSRYNYFRSMII